LKSKSKSKPKPKIDLGEWFLRDPHDMKKIKDCFHALMTAYAESLWASKHVAEACARKKPQVERIEQRLHTLGKEWASRRIAFVEHTVSIQKRVDRCLAELRRMDIPYSREGTKLYEPHSHVFQSNKPRAKVISINKTEQRPDTI
jgi:hypothetical protein